MQDRRRRSPGALPPASACGGRRWRTCSQRSPQLQELGAHMQADRTGDRRADFEVYAVVFQIKIDGAPGFQKSGRLANGQQSCLDWRSHALEIRATDEENVAVFHVAKPGIAAHLDAAAVH